MRNKNSTNTLLKVTNGTIGTITDMLLFQLYLPFAMAGKHSHYEMERAIEETHQFISEVNYKTIQSAIFRLIRSKHITKEKTTAGTHLLITKTGTDRISSVLSPYQTSRPWNAVFYLVSYDIPAKANRKRDIVRSNLFREGARLLQDSLWITPYNPSKALKQLVERYAIPGTIIVSKLGKDGAIGEERFEDLVRRLWRLDEINERYKIFLDTYKNGSQTSLLKLAMDYMTIVNDDPQLPFELEPSDFLGKQAYEFFKLHARA